MALLGSTLSSVGLLAGKISVRPSSAGGATVVGAMVGSVVLPFGGLRTMGQELNTGLVKWQLANYSQWPFEVLQQTIPIGPKNIFSINKLHINTKING